jgi:hypothetical protein
MSERTSASLRVLLLVLAVANVLVFLYVVLAPNPQAETASRIEELQINPGRIKVLGAASRGPGGGPASAKGDKSVSHRACLQWGPFPASHISRIEDALAKLSLAEPPVQHSLSAADGSKRYVYFLREPDARIVAQVAELQRGFPGTEIKAAPCPS